MNEDVEGNARGKSDRERLMWLGERLDYRRVGRAEETLGMWLAQALLRVRDREGRTVPLEANAAQRAFERRRGRTNIVLKARQMGISTWVAGRFFLKTITRPGTLTVQVAHNREAAEQIFQIVHRFYGQLPDGLRAGDLKVSRANAGQMVFCEIDSEYRVESAADVNAGRGMTIQNLHCSEVARWAGDAGATMASLRAALVPEGELVLESTPNGAQGHFYEEWMRAEETGMVRHFFPWWMEPAYVASRVAEADWTDEERDLASTHGLTPEQIGYRRALQSRFRGMAAQEYAENAEGCFVSSGQCVFEIECVERRAREAVSPVETRVNGNLWIWYLPQAGRTYVMGVDAAGGGTDGDYATAQVIDMETGLQCAELRAHLSPDQLAKEAATLAREYNDAIVAVERNNHGGSVLAYLSVRERYAGIYEQNGQAGWLTSAASKPEMIAMFSETLVERPRTISSVRLLAECRTFIRQGDGRMGAAGGAHDDCVMAMAIALRVRAETMVR